MLRISPLAPRLLAAFLVSLGSLGLLATEVFAQQKQVPLFYDARRLPDMEVERRNQEVLLEQQRLKEERNVESAANAKRKADDERRFALDAAETQRKADEERRLAAEAEAKQKTEDARLAAAADAQRKADEEKRIAADAEAKKKTEDARLAAAADAQRKADEEKRVAADAEAKKKAEDARLAAAAEAQRKADEEKRVAADAEAKKRAEDARLAAAAEAQRKADEEKRVAALNEASKKQSEDARLAALSAAASAAKRKADEDQRNRLAAETAVKPKADDPRGASPATAPTPLPQTAALTPQLTNAAKTTPATTAAPCEAPGVKGVAKTGGRVEVVIDSPCRRGQPVVVQYAGYDFVRKLNSNGQAAINLDLFAGGTEPAKVSFADGSSQNITAKVTDLGEVSKVALIWNSPVDLTLHAHEAGGSPDKGVWSGAPSSAEAAKALIATTGRGTGFMSTVNGGVTEGPRMEVYTFIHSPEQDVGAVSMSLDYASRGITPTGDMCGQGSLAEIPFDVVITDRKGQVQRESGLIPAVKCGEAIPEKARLLRGAVPDLRFRR